MIAIASDHAGYNLKCTIAGYLKEKGIAFDDLGTFDGDTSVDYNDYGVLVAEAIRNGTHDRGIIICGTGIGISISANKVPGARAALCTNCYMAKMSRSHNNANILALGARVIGPGLALEIVETWLNTEFEGGERHTRRVNKFSAIEEKYNKI